MELLEYLRVHTDCTFISDLRRYGSLHSIKLALDNLDIRQYSIQEWNEAASYITGTTNNFLEVDEVVKYLKSLPGEQEDSYEKKEKI